MEKPTVNVTYKAENINGFKKDVKEIIVKLDLDMVIDNKGALYILENAKDSLALSPISWKIDGHDKVTLLKGKVENMDEIRAYFKGEDTRAYDALKSMF